MVKLSIANVGTKYVLLGMMQSATHSIPYVILLIKVYILG